MKEGVTYLIDAEDRATAKIRKTTAEVNKQVSQVKELGGQSKASTELVGTLATSLGGTGVGAFAGEISMLTERVSAFSEVSKAGGAGAMAFKAGLVGVAAVMSFKVGNAIGNAIFQTEKFNKSLEDATATALRLDSVSLGLFMARIKGDLPTVNNELKETTEKIRQLRKEVARLDESGGDFAVYDTNLQNRIKSKKAEIETSQGRIAALNAERLAILKMPTKSQQADDKNSDVLAQLRLDVEKASAKDFIERTRIELRQRGVLHRSMEVAMSLAVRKKRIDDANAKAKEDAARKAIAAEKAIADAEKARLKARRDGLDAIIKKESEVTKNLKDQVADLKKNDKSTLTGPLQAGASQRLTTGRASASFKKTAAVIEAERQTKIQKSQEKLMAQIAASLQRMEKAKTGIKVLGN